MAMTQLALLFIGTLATLATLGLFVDFADRWTQLVVSFLASLLWGMFGISSFDVIVRDAGFATASEPIMPLVYLGVGMSMIIAVYAFADLVVGLGQEASDTDISEALK